MRNQLLTVLCFVTFVASPANATQMVGGAVGNTVEPATTYVVLPVAKDGEIIDSLGSGAIEAVLPMIKTNNGISYITGGIGDEELEALKTQESNFNAHVLVVSTNGEYMSEVAIRFLDKENVEVLRILDGGPFFYVDLPAGTYTVEAASNIGTIQKAKLVASAKTTASRRVVIRFNE
jgi:hypothetical protein